MLVDVVEMKQFAHDNEKMLKTWVTNTDPIMTGVEKRQKQRDYDERDYDERDYDEMDCDETMLKPWGTNTDPIMSRVEKRQKQRDFEKRISNIEFELKKQKEKERMENNMPEFFKKPYKIPAY